MAKKASRTETFTYQTEIRKLLDIVIHSLYTNREIFIRELISNAADALEKMRHVTLTQENYVEKDLPLEIGIEVSKDAKTLTISDTGVGMTKDELIENLGTIAHSGTQEFLEKLAEAKEVPSQLIGQFGVGFYSSFMAAKRVKVITRSYKPGSKGWLWQSDGVSDFTIEPEEGIQRGTRIVLELNEEAEQYADEDQVKNIIKQYSNFVPFSIKVGEETVNTIQATWVKNPKEIEDSEYTEFYKFIANAQSDPRYHLHLSADAPIQLNSLVFIPKENMESFGFSRLEPGVALYCNKILIDSQPKDLLPDYLRFVRGVVDSEDLPLNISRETLQDNRIVRKISKFLTKRIISFLQEQATSDPDKYKEFWEHFNIFIKEGAHTDYDNRDGLAKLLRFESTRFEKDEWQSLEGYVAGMSGEHKEIYYLTGQNREEVEASPYLEIFKQHSLEVHFCYDPVDDFVLSGLREFDGKRLVSVDQANLNLPADARPNTEEEQKKQEKELGSLIDRIKEVAGERLEDVRFSTRLVDSPAMLVNPDDMFTTSMQKILQATHKEYQGVGKKVLEINPNHGLIRKLTALEDEQLSVLIIDQLIDNAFIAAGLKTNPQTMIKRINELLEKTL